MFRLLFDVGAPADAMGYIASDAATRHGSPRGISRSLITLTGQFEIAASPSLLNTL